MIRKLVRAVAAVMASALLILTCACASASDTGEVLIYAVNVGKADAIIVKVNEKYYLIDAGTSDSYPALERALESAGVSSLAGVFLTHTDKDHGGGMVKLSKSEMSVDAWYAPAIFFEKDIDDHQANEAAAIRGQDVSWLRAGDIIDIDGESSFTVLAPINTDEDDENNNSLVMMLTTPGGKALFTGDMMLGEETDLLMSGVDLKCDYLKVGHHGGPRATGSMFLLAASPEVAVISTSTDERPATPDPDVMERLRAAGVSVYVTQDYEMGVLASLSGGKVYLLDWRAQNTAA